MKKALLFICLLFFVGCLGHEVGTNYNYALEEYKCSEQEYKVAIKESTICRQNTDYSKTYCFSTSIMRNCKVMVRK